LNGCLVDSYLQDRLLDVALEAARRGGEVLVRHFGAPARGVDTKTTPTDPVSDADRESEQVIRTLLSKRRPDDGIVGEEAEGRAGTSGLEWVVDPLDGTVNFLFGRRDWCVSIGLEDADGGLVGVIHDPLGDETFTAVRGRGAFLNGSRIELGGCSDLTRALIGTGFSYDAAAREVQAERVARLLPRVRDVRRAGSAALDLAALACGRLDGFYEAPMERWDRSAGVLLIEEAGGVISDLPGPLGLSPGVIAANPALHPAFAELVLGAQ
jgi:myo-inositol-1(or 4)-monophosphatase